MSSLTWKPTATPVARTSTTGTSLRKSGSLEVTLPISGIALPMSLSLVLSSAHNGSFRSSRSAPSKSAFSRSNSAKTPLCAAFAALPPGSLRPLAAYSSFAARRSWRDRHPGLVLAQRRDQPLQTRERDTDQVTAIRSAKLDPDVLAVVSRPGMSRHEYQRFGGHTSLPPDGGDVGQETSTPSTRIGRARLAGDSRTGLVGGALPASGRGSGCRAGG